jgi:hypothetical protein
MTRAPQPLVLWGLFLAAKLIHLPDELAGVTIPRRQHLDDIKVLVAVAAGFM